MITHWHCPTSIGSAGLAIGPDGAAYVGSFGIVPGAVPPALPQGGQVLRITLD